MCVACVKYQHHAAWNFDLLSLVRSMMHIVMDGASAERSQGSHGPPSDAVQEALALCSDACRKVLAVLLSYLLCFF